MMPDYAVTNLLTDRNTNPVFIQIIGEYIKDKKTIGLGMTFSVNPPEI